jgi:hypothetical protein
MCFAEAVTQQDHTGSTLVKAPNYGTTATRRPPMKNQHEPVEHMVTLQWMAGFWVALEDSNPIYDLPCTYCLPIWERMAARERGDKPQVTSNESFTSDFS